MTDSPTPPARYANGRFGPGHPGRPRGARNRRPHRIADAMLAHFEKRQEDILDVLCEGGRFDEYMELITPLLPKSAEELEAPEVKRMDPEQKADILLYVRGALERLENGTGTQDEIDAAFAGEYDPQQYAPKSGKRWEDLGPVEADEEGRWLRERGKK